jgi:hypothetical protein
MSGFSIVLHATDLSECSMAAFPGGRLPRAAPADRSRGARTSGIAPGSSASPALW